MMKFSRGNSWIGYPFALEESVNYVVLSLARNNANALYFCECRLNCRGNSIVVAHTARMLFNLWKRIGDSRDAFFYKLVGFDVML